MCAHKIHGRSTPVSDRGDGLGERSDPEEASLLHLHEVLAIAHAHGFVIDELAVAGDRNRTGGDRELPAKGRGYATHLATLLAVGPSVLWLRDGCQGGERNGACSGGEKALQEGAASEGPVRHRLGLSFCKSRGFCLENADSIRLREVVKDLQDCCRFSATK